MAHRLPLPITSALFSDYNYKLPITLTARFDWPEARLLVISNAHPYSQELPPDSGGERDNDLVATPRSSPQSTGSYTK